MFSSQNITNRPTVLVLGLILLGYVLFTNLIWPPILTYQIHFEGTGELGDAHLGDTFNSRRSKVIDQVPPPLLPPPDYHPVFQIFAFNNFPPDSHNQKRNQAASAMIEAIEIIVEAYNAMNDMSDSRIRNSFLRYFNERDEPSVRLVLEGLVRQLGGQIFEGARQCIPIPELLPLAVWYDSPPEYPRLCESASLALPGEVDDNDPGAKAQYVVICPKWFEFSRWRLVAEIDPLKAGRWASSHGHGPFQDDVGAGLETASTDILHELLHWWDFLGHWSDKIIVDQIFTIPEQGFVTNTEARTPWLCNLLKKRQPQKVDENVESYMWFIREVFFIRRFNRDPFWDPPQDVQPGDIRVDPRARPYGFDEPLNGPSG